MKATINVEFTDQELTGLVERWANKVVVGALGDLANQVGPLIPAIRDAVMRAVTGQAAAAPASGVRNGEPLCNDCEEGLKTHCVAFESPYTGPGWACHECRSCNGLQRAQCKRCGHARCGEGARSPLDTNVDNVLVKYDQMLILYPADTLYISVKRVSGESAAQQGIASVPRNGAELFNALKIVHGRREEAVYSVVFLDAKSKEYRGKGQITMPDTRAPSSQGQSVDFPTPSPEG